MLTYGGERLRVGRGGAGVPDEIAERLRALADRYARRDPRALSADPAPRLGLQPRRAAPRERLPRRARARRHRGHVRDRSSRRPLHLVPTARRAARSLVLGYPDDVSAPPTTSRIVARARADRRSRGSTSTLVEDMTLLGIHRHELSMLPDGRGWLLVEFGGETKEEADEKARALMRDLEKDGQPPSGMKLYDDPDSEQHIWEVREAGLGATAFVPGKPDTREGWEDSAVPPERLGDYLREPREARASATATRARSTATSARAASTPAGTSTWSRSRRHRDVPALRSTRRPTSCSSSAARSPASTATASRARELLPKMFGDELVEAFREFKSIWDPDWKMNPGKVVDPYRDRREPAARRRLRAAGGRDALRLPARRRRLRARDRRAASASASAARPTGRRHVPELHGRRARRSTRPAAARICSSRCSNGEVITDGWQSDEVSEALDLCLACKGCKNDCPVNVDMADLQGRVPLATTTKDGSGPRHAYAFGLIDRWARLASRAPGLVNFVTQTPPFAQALQARRRDDAGAAGPGVRAAHAPAVVRAARRDDEPGRAEGRPLARHLQQPLPPGVGVAAVEVLEAAGFQVDRPRGPCLLRPAALRLRHARPGASATSERSLDALRDEIRAGIPIVGLEPSCVAVFRDELAKLLPHDEDAKRLAQQHVPLRRVPREVRCRAAAARAQGVRPGPLPPQGDRRHRSARRSC